MKSEIHRQKRWSFTDWEFNIYRNTGDSLNIDRIIVVVPKRIIKKSSKRNRIKRIFRSAYRLVKERSIKIIIQRWEGHFYKKRFRILQVVFKCLRWESNPH